jgi:glucokinase
LRAKTTIGVDIGGTSVRAGVVDRHGNVLDTARAPTPAGEAALEDAIVSAVTGLAVRHRVTGVGLAVAGFVTTDRRSVMFAPHLAWRDAPVGDRISKRLKLPVVLEHDANAALLGEHPWPRSWGTCGSCRAAARARAASRAAGSGTAAAPR